MSRDERIANVLSALGDDFRLQVAHAVYTANKPMTITELRDVLGGPTDIQFTQKLHYSLNVLHEKGVLVRDVVGPGHAHRYEINPEYAADVLAFLVNVLT